MKILETKPPGTLWATQGLLRDTFTFYWSETNPNEVYVEPLHIQSNSTDWDIVVR